MDECRTGNKKEFDILVLACKSQVPHKLRNPNISVNFAKNLSDLETQMIRDHSLTAQAASWAVKTWASSLNVGNELIHDWLPLDLSIFQDPQPQKNLDIEPASADLDCSVAGQDAISKTPTPVSKPSRAFTYALLGTGGLTVAALTALSVSWSTASPLQGSDRPGAPVPAPSTTRLRPSETPAAASMTNQAIASPPMPRARFSPTPIQVVEQQVATRSVVTSFTAPFPSVTLPAKAIPTTEVPTPPAPDTRRTATAQPVRTPLTSSSSPPSQPTATSQGSRQAGQASLPQSTAPPEPTSPPQKTAPAESTSPPQPTAPPEPTAVPTTAPMVAAVPTDARAPSPTVAPTDTRAPTPSPAPTNTRVPTPTVAPTETRAPTPTTPPTNTRVPTQTPVPSATVFRSPTIAPTVQLSSPTLSSPSNGARVLKGQSVTLTWSPVNRASGYQVEISNEDDPNAGGSFTASGTSYPYTFGSGGFWNLRVRALGADGQLPGPPSSNVRVVVPY